MNTSTVRILLGSIMLALLVLAGCAPRPVVDERPDRPEAFPHHTLSEIQEELFVPSDTLTSMEARAQLRVRSPEQSGTFSADVRHRRNDSLYIGISPGFGIEAARMLVTPDSFYVYDRIKRELTYGSVETGNRVLPIPLESTQIMPNLLGMLQPHDHAEWELTADEEHYFLTSPDDSEQYTVDPSLWRVVHYARRGVNGDLLEERTFSEFDVVDGYYIPRRVELERPQEDMYASIYYRDLTLNPEALSFDLRVSSRASRVPALQASGTPSID